MKASLITTGCIIGCIALALGLLPQRSHAEFEVSASVSIQSPSDFYQPLGDEGMWVDVGSYGRCWRPAGVASGWRPYCAGYWEWTDCGWYWVSDEPWAWACYHYGNWVYDSNYGWVWLPGVQWAPAWVYWRTGGDYIGWAPCAPGGVDIAPTAYVFVEQRHFHDHLRPDRVIVNNTTIINQTTVIRDIRRETREIDGRQRSVYVNNGPRVETVSKATGHRFSQVSVQQAQERTFRSASPSLKRATSEKGMSSPSRQFQEQPRPNPERHQELPRNNAPHQEIPAQPAPRREQAVPQPNRERMIPQPEQRERIVPAPGRETIVPPPNREQVVPRTPPEQTRPNDTPREQFREAPNRDVPRAAEPRAVPRELAPPPQQRAVPAQPQPSETPRDRQPRQKDRDENDRGREP